MREWDFFFFIHCFFFQSGGSLGLLERYGGAVVRGSPLSEVHLVTRSLLNIPVRLLDLPPLYRRSGVADPYLGR